MFIIKLVVVFGLPVNGKFFHGVQVPSFFVVVYNRHGIIYLAELVACLQEMLCELGITIIQFKGTIIIPSSHNLSCKQATSSAR
jgi:hypothetical protein